MFKKEYFNLRKTRSSLVAKSQKNPKKVIIIMLLIMGLGIGWLIVKIYQSEKKEPKESMVEKIMHPIDTTQFFKESPADKMFQLQEVMRLESKTKSILKKDTLSKEDSIFLLQVDQKLNNILNEKD